MGQITHALIEHRLNPDEILTLPELLKTSSNKLISNHWNWTISNINLNTLTNFWSRNTDYFINNPWSEEDLPLLKFNKLTLFFLSPNLVTFDNSIPWNSYNTSEVLRKEFNSLAKEISSFLKPIDIIIVPDLSSVSFFNEDQGLTVKAYGQKANGNKLYAAEIL